MCRGHVGPDLGVREVSGQLERGYRNAGSAGHTGGGGSLGPGDAGGGPDAASCKAAGVTGYYQCRA